MIKLNNLNYGKYLKYFKIAIHHGGSGTTHDCILYNVPQIIVSQFVDQPLYGNLIELLGIGKWIKFS